MFQFEPHEKRDCGLGESFWLMVIGVEILVFRTVCEVFRTCED